MDDYNAAIRLRPADARVYVARGNEWKRDLKLDNALADYNTAIQVDSRYIPAYVARAMISRQRRDFPRAAAELTAIAEAVPEDAEVHRLLARILATCNNESVRDGQRAVREATRACELTGWTDPDSIDTLAAAYAEAGDYATAVRWQTKAVEIMRKKVTSTLKRSMDFGGRRGVGFEDRLAFYKRKRPARVVDPIPAGSYPPEARNEYTRPHRCKCRTKNAVISRNIASSGSSFAGKSREWRTTHPMPISSIRAFSTAPKRGWWMPCPGRASSGRSASGSE